jgi:hypothetical protein
MQNQLVKNRQEILQLNSQITFLESNSIKTSAQQVELESKRKRLQELQDQEKTLFKSLPIDTQISILRKEIKELSNKSSKTKAEQALLESKKKELDRLLAEKNKSNTMRPKPSDKTTLIICLGIVTIFLIFGIFIIARIRKKKKY